MMQRSLFLLLCLLLCLWYSTFAQTQQFWQQEVNYNIQVTLDDQRHMLLATEEIEYINHSPHELTFIYFHLWPNAYRNTRTAFARQLLINNSLNFQYAKEEQRGFIDGLSFTVDGEPARLEPDPEHIDVARLLLNRPLPSGGRVRIITPFEVKIPHAFSRLGHLDQSYQITQWYPKPAVFDHKGWHAMPYLDKGEFYSEFGRFEVSITLPANYTVGATGVLQNPEEQARLDSLAAITALKTTFPPEDPFPASAPNTKTLRYVQDNIHDFAWFADKRFNVLKSMVALPGSGRMVTTWLMFLNRQAARWQQSVKEINEAIYYYSLWVGEYPYEQATAVDAPLGAGAGMEYPMVTVTSPEALVHEIGHNWFYGILASHERIHPWMDEGMNTYLENRIARLQDPFAGDLSSLLHQPGLTRLFGLEKLNANALNLLPYQMSASRGLDQPVELPAPDFRDVNYGLIVYAKVAHLFQYLAAYLGQERFDTCMRAYYDRWQFRHPYPEDLQAVFEEVSGEPLDWFFGDLMHTINRVNVAPVTVSQVAEGTAVTVRNRSKARVPVEVGAFSRDGQLLESLWTQPLPAGGTQTLTFASRDIHHFLTDPESLLPEIHRNNNLIRTSGLFPRARPLRPQLFAGIEQPTVKQLYFFPVLGWNTWDRFMPGLVLSNSSLVEKRLSLLAMPMYSFRQRQLKGIADASYALYRGEAGQLRLGLNAWSFERFDRVAPALTFTPRLRLATSPRQQVQLKYTQVWQEQDAFYIIPGADEASQPMVARLPEYQAVSASYNLENRNALRTIGLGVELHHFSYPEGAALAPGNSTNLAQATFRFSRTYRPGRRVQARLFGGSFFGGPSPFFMGMSGSFDYLKEEIFLDRSQQSGNQQAVVHHTDGRDGGFRNFLPQVSNDWMATLNLTGQLPVTPLSVYLDLGTIGQESKLFYGTGLLLSGTEGVISLYLPVAGSNFDNGFVGSYREFRQNIRLLLRLSTLNPFRLLRENL
jgi:hypothetical protein